MHRRRFATVSKIRERCERPPWCALCPQLGGSSYGVLLVVGWMEWSGARSNRKRTAQVRGGFNSLEISNRVSARDWKMFQTRVPTNSVRPIARNIADYIQGLFSRSNDRNFEGESFYARTWRRLFMQIRHFARKKNTGEYCREICLIF